MADRCTVPGAEKVIWSVKATAQFNSDCAFLLREAFRSGRIRLIATEYDADEYLSEIKAYASLSPSEKLQIKLPYIQTTLLIDELTKLQHETTNGKVKIFEKAGMRKDRYSSLSYNYYVAIQLENKVSKKSNNSLGENDWYVIKPPSGSRKAVRGTNGYAKNRTWW